MPSYEEKLTQNELTFNRISYSVKIKGEEEPKRILNAVSGHFSNGLNAIMGPSGSGKTSLLDILSDRINLTGVSGEILLDGRPTPPNFQLISGYVVQDDVVMGTLTVRENLLFSANLRLPSTLTRAEKAAKVDEIIRQLGLQSCADSLIGNELKRGVSGGERKRCNVGTELLTSPKILFLDEPTTGLDASTSFNLTSLLDDIGKRANMTVIMSIHQPRASIFKQINRISVLSRGHTVYHGEQSQLLPYFSTLGLDCEEFDNPADFLLDVVILNEPAVGTEQSMQSPDDPQQKIFDLASSFKDKQEKEKDDGSEEEPDLLKKKKLKPTYQTSFLSQIYYLMARSWLTVIRNPLAFNVQLVSAVVFGFIMALIYANAGEDLSDPVGFMNRYGFFQLISQNVIFGSQAVLEIFRVERTIFLHERSNGYYRTLAYFFSKLLIEIFIFRTQTIVIYALTTYWIIGLVNDAQHFFTFFVTMWTLMFAAMSLLLVFTISFNDPQVGQLIVTIPTMISTIFGGLFINIDTLPVYLQWLPYVAMSRYPMEMFSTNEMADLQFHGSRMVKQCNDWGDDCHWVSVKYNVSGSELLDQQGVPSDRGSIWINEGILIAATLVMFLLTFVQLTLIKKRK